MIHYSAVAASVFDKIQDGHKVIEPRINDAVHRQVKLGDMIVIINRDTHKELLVKVVGVLRYKTFAELFKAFPSRYFGFDSAEAAMAEVRKWYSPNDEAEHGVLGIKVHVMEADRR